MDDEQVYDNEEESPILEIIKSHSIVIVCVLIGLCALAYGLMKTPLFDGGDSAVVIESTADTDEVIVVEVSGAVESPGVFQVDKGMRIEDVLSKAGGISADADTVWIEKTLNKASVVLDGQKIFIPRISEQLNAQSANDEGGYQTVSSGNYADNANNVNINESSSSELEALWGIGQVTAQNIIDQRPYSTVEELVTRKIIKENVFEKNKDLLTVY